MQSKRITIENKQGLNLAGQLDLPNNGAPHAFAIFSHCFTCGKNLKAIRTISSALAKQGIASLRFDYTGLGESEGIFADSNFNTNVDDLVSVYQYLSEHFQAPELLIGHSLGGAAALAAVQSMPGIKAIATIGTPSSAAHVLKHFKAYHQQINDEGQADVPIDGRTFTIKKQFLDCFDHIDLAASIRQLDKALLILHSPLDQTVDVEHAGKIFQLAKHPKSFVSLDDADHLLSSKHDAEFAGQLIGSWSKKYFSEAPTTLVADDGKVLVQTGQDNYFTDAFIRQHHIVLDEPHAIGGQDLGPKPSELIAAALGACTSITLRMYTDRKKMNMANISVEVTSSLHEGQLTLVRNIKLGNKLDSKQSQRMLDIANRCPVHKLLSGGINIETQLVDD